MSLIIYILMRRQLLLLAALALLVASQPNLLFKRVIHNSDPFAKCLDGSSPALFIHEGDPDRILLNFMAGSNCQGTTEEEVLEDCYQRSKTEFGSSNFWPEFLPGQGILSVDPSINFMANWTKVFITYCDGSWHQGYNQDPVRFKDGELFFRGGLNTWSHLKYLNDRYGLYTAKQVVLSGSSAGGIATYMWADRIAGLLAPWTQFSAIADSAIFLDIDPSASSADSFGTGILYGLANTDLDPPNRQCVKENPQVPQACFNIQTALSHLKTRTLFLQSSYDQFLMTNLLNFTCLTEGTSGFSLENCGQAQLGLYELYRGFYLNFIAEEILPRGHSVWTISCSSHAGSFLSQIYNSDLQRVPQLTGQTMNEAAYDFIVEKKNVVKIDREPWPSNTPCAK